MSEKQFAENGKYTPNDKQIVVPEIAYNDMQDIIENEKENGWTFHALDTITWNNLSKKNTPAKDFYMLTFVQDDQ